jgi:hypothetical protein
MALTRKSLAFHASAVAFEDRISQSTMPSTLKLPSAITLNDGRVLPTLDDARTILQSLPQRRQRREYCLYAGELLKEAATGRGSLSETRKCILLALMGEGLI